MKDDKKSETYKNFVKASSAGLEVGLSIVAGVLLGYFADKYFGFKPWGFLLGLVFGAAAAFKRLFLFVKKYQKEQEDERRNKPDA